MITTDVGALAADEHTDGIVIASSPPEHAGHILQAVGAGKGIYLEKPMVTLFEDFKRVWQVMDATPVLFTMGLNRRYSPLVATMREMIEEPVQSITYLVNQQPVPADHRTVDEFEGGGRLVSEAEHFIDLCNFVIGHPPTTVQGRPLGPAPGDLRRLSSFALTLWYDGAVANIIYDESGASTFPRERVTATGRGQVATLDDFARLTIQGRKKRAYGGGKRQMGHREALTQFVSALRGESNTMLTWQDASLATLCMFAAQESIRSGEPVDLRSFRSVMASQAGT
jgi:predicted dehydrogenase